MVIFYIASHISPRLLYISSRAVSRWKAIYEMSCHYLLYHKHVHIEISRKQQKEHHMMNDYSQQSLRVFILRLL